MTENRLSTPAADRLRRAEGVWSKPVQDQAVLYHWDQGKAIVLNATGAALWEALETCSTASGLADILVARFPGLSPERARADVAVFLDRLQRESVIESGP